MSGTAIISSGLNTTQNMVLNSGTLYVFDISAGCSSYTTSGALISNKFLTGYTTAHGTVQLNASSFYVPDFTQSKVFKYSLAGVKDDTFNLSVSSPIGNTFYNNTYYVSSYPSKIVKTFNFTTGVLINSSFITVASGNILSMLVNENRLYIGTDTNIIYVYNATTGSVINSTFITSTINGPFNMICDYSYLYVVSYNGGNVDIFNLITGAFVSNLVSGITNPRGIAIDSSNIYVANSSASSTVYKKENPYYSPVIFPVPWGAYIAGHTNNTTTSLYDFTGNGRNATIGGTGVNLTNQASGNGASASIPFITGTSSTTITWPTGSIPTNFTILSMTRYTTAPYARILQASGLDFIIGHWNASFPTTSSPGHVGVEYHQQWMTQNGANSPNVSSATNWLVMCGTNGGTTPNNILVNGVGNGTSTGGFSNSTLTINTGTAGTQSSNFAFQQVLIWDTSLTASQMQTISNIVMTYMSTGSITYPWTGPTNPINGLISQYDFNYLLFNSKTQTNDLSLVNVGTVTAPITRVSSKIKDFDTFSLYQSVMNDTGFSYYTSNSTNSLRSTFSVSFWVNVTGANTIGSLICLGDSNTNIISINSDTNKLYIGIRTNNSESYATSIGTTTGVFTYGSYNHIVLVCGTNAGQQTIQVYVNNVLLTSYAVITLAGTGISISGSTITSNIIFNGTSPNLYILGGRDADTITWPRNGSSIRSRPAQAYISQITIYNVALTPTDVNYLFNVLTIPPYPCFLQGTKILRFSPDTYQDVYSPVETLRPGDLIATSESGYKSIHSIGYKTIPRPKSDPNPSNRLYKFSKQFCQTVFEPLYITGEHCTLHRNISAEKLKLITEHMGDIYITEEYYRMPALLDDRATPYDGEDKPVTIWHFSLEHENVAHNYGVFANGLLVESCAIESLIEKSGMRLLEE